MNDAWKVFEAPFDDRAQLAVDRALAELRAGRPILIEGAAGTAVVAAVDALSPSLLDAMSQLGGNDASLAVSMARAHAIGLPADGPVSIAIAGHDRDDLYRLASGADLRAPASWRLAGRLAVAGIELCKRALLLPALLVIEGGATDRLPASIHRLAFDEVRGLLDRRLHCLEIVSRARVPLAGEVEASFVVFRAEPGLRDQVAIVVGEPDPAGPVVVRMHSACLTGDLFGSLRCDCGDQLRQSVSRLSAEGGGVLLYLDQEGRGTGIRNKIRAYALQDEGFDTIDADALLGYGADERRYDLAAGMLLRLGFRRVHLLTNNPDKIAALRRAGIAVEGRQALNGVVTAENHRYLATKARRAGHLLDMMPSLPRQIEGG